MFFFCRRGARKEAPTKHHDFPCRNSDAITQSNGREICGRAPKARVGFGPHEPIAREVPRVVVLDRRGSRKATPTYPYDSPCNSNCASAREHYLGEFLCICLFCCIATAQRSRSCASRVHASSSNRDPERFWNEPKSSTRACAPETRGRPQSRSCASRRSSGRRNARGRRLRRQTLFVAFAPWEIHGVTRVLPAVRVAPVPRRHAGATATARGRARALAPRNGQSSPIM